MSRQSKLLSTLLFLTLLTLLASREVSAGPIRLEYKGKTYTSVDNDPLIDGEYTKSMRVTGWVDLADSLEANSTYEFRYEEGSFDDGLLGFSFFDGVWHHDDHSDASPWSVGAWDTIFHFTTDAKANIVAWDVFWTNLLAPGVPQGGGDMDMWMSSVGGDGGYLLCDNCDPFRYQAFSTTRIGRWTVVPEPSSFSLLLVGVTAIGLHRSRKLRV